jgi:hypothetical protein
MPATVEALKTYLGIEPASTVDGEAMAAACDAANDMAVAWRPDVTTDDDGAPLTVWPARIDQGALTYAARLYGRRGSVAGVAAFTETGVTHIARLDPDVRALWELGEYQRNVVA